MLQNSDLTCVIEPTEGRGGLYQSSILCAQNIELLKQNSIFAIITCSIESQLQYPPEFQQLKLECHDYPMFDMNPLFSQSQQFMDKYRQTGNVLVHCQMGKSRSSCLILAYLIKKRKMTLSQALGYLKAQRPMIQPNPGFIQQLLQFEKEQFGNVMSVLTPQLTPYYYIQFGQGSLQNMEYVKLTSGSPQQQHHLQQSHIHHFQKAPQPNQQTIQQPIQLLTNSIQQQNQFPQYASPVKPTQQVQYSTPIVQPTQQQQQYFFSTPVLENNVQNQYQPYQDKLRHAIDGVGQQQVKTYPVPVSKEITPALRKSV